MILTKQERLKLFFSRLTKTPPASNFEEAYLLLEQTLNAVEDEFSGAAYDPNFANHQQRMYKPLDDRKYIENDLVWYKNVRNKTFFNANGAILITDLQNNTLVSIAGKDGRKIRR